MRIAVDFDDTLYLNGSANTNLIGYLKTEQLKGTTIVLHTSREGESLQQAVAFCDELGLVFDDVFGGKPLADMYIDDKAKRPEEISRPSGKMTSLKRQRR